VTVSKTQLCTAVKPLSLNGIENTQTSRNLQ